MFVDVVDGPFALCWNEAQARVKADCEGSAIK